MVITPRAAARRALLVGAVVLLVGCGGASAPDFEDGELVKLRASAAAKARSAVDGVVMLSGGRLRGRASYDGCYEGQQNYKVDEGYAYRCSVRAVGVVGLSGDFRPRIAALDARLFASGWALCSTCGDKDRLSWLLDDYWDYRVSLATPAVPFSISWLPTPGQPYEQGELLLTFAYGGRDVGGRETLESAHRMHRGGFFRSDERVRLLDTPAVLARARAREHLVVVAIEIDYYEA